MDDGYELFGMDSFAEEIWTDIVEGEKRNAAQQEQQEQQEVDACGEYEIEGARNGHS